MPNSLVPVLQSNNDGPSVRGIVETVDATLALGLFFDLLLYRKGSFYIPTAGNTSWTWKASATKDGTYVKIQDAGTAGVQTATAAAWNDIPAPVFNHRYVQVIPGADVAGVAFDFAST
jgi:hypothetical protein